MKKIMKLVIGIVLFAGCDERDKTGRQVDTPTAGRIEIFVDESLRPLIDAEIKAFEGIYHNAHIEVTYASEGEAIKALVNDSARLAIVTRKLLKSEEQSLNDQTIFPHQLKMATGAIALIANRQYPDTLITMDEIRKILHGNMKTIHVQKNNVPTLSVVVFDQPNSGIVRFLRDSVTDFDTLPDYCFAVENNSSVVEYVSKSPHALGLIDVSWISDRDDSTSNSFLNSIRVIAVSGDSGFFRPYQAYIAQRRYPLVRDIVMISREARSGLASGFMAFVASDKGQRIVLKSGLVPATMPVRIIEINHEPF
jgi:phosphate transport system substrate-binding protein